MIILEFATLSIADRSGRSVASLVLPPPALLRFRIMSIDVKCRSSALDMIASLTKNPLETIQWDYLYNENGK